jgi:hypothetical protein
VPGASNTQPVAFIPDGPTILAKAIAQGWLVAGALLAGRSHHLLAGRLYRVVMRVLAVLLALFALLLFTEGLRHLALI